MDWATLILIWKVGFGVCTCIGLVSGLIYILIAIVRTIKHYAWHRQFKFIVETPYSHELDQYVPSEDRNKPLMNGYAHLCFYGYFPFAFLIAGAIASAIAAMGVIWPIGIPILIIIAICEAAYKLNGQNRLAAELAGTMPEPK